MLACWSAGLQSACYAVPDPANTPSCRSSVLQAGNEAVLRARFEDAQFFYNNDLTTPLADARWVQCAELADSVRSPAAWAGGAGGRAC